MLTDLGTGSTMPLTTDRGHLEHGHVHPHHHDHGHAHHHSHEPDDAIGRALHEGRLIRLEQDLLAKNRLLAERNRGWLEARGILAINLISSPGAGKTTLLERTIRDLGDAVSIAVIEGDQATLHDA
jgi:hydrogenase nickel incorporation protein HypB